MDRVQVRRSKEPPCISCGEITPKYDNVNYASNEKGCRQLFSQCFNAEAAKSDGLDKFEHVRFDPVELADCTDEVHVFHFRTRLFGPGVALDAFELRDGHPAGYQFQVIGDPEDDLLALLGRLIDKIRRALSIIHIGDGKFGLQIADHRVVRGMVGWDAAEDGRVPLLTIDGREITWEELGHMLMTYEGWQFKLEILDKSLTDQWDVPKESQSRIFNSLTGSAVNHRVQAMSGAN